MATARHSWRDAATPLLLAMGGLVSLVTVDAPLSYYLLNHTLPSVLRELFRVVEAFGNGLGVVLIAWAIFQLDIKHRVALPRLISVALGAGGLTSLVKLFVARHRPASSKFTQDDIFVGFGDVALQFAESAANAFPSGHTATAVALSIALVSLYPRARGLFWFAAVAVACQRVAHGSHFVSDVCFGALIGWTTAFFAYRFLPCVTRLDRLERGVKRVVNSMLPS